jgi:coenzyme PQQ precursor peptide PqqA
MAQDGAARFSLTGEGRRPSHLFQSRQTTQTKQASEIHACSPKPKDGFQTSEESMAWKAPEIIEVAVGLEINMYACASLKK